MKRNTERERLGENIGEDEYEGIRKISKKVIDIK